MSVKPLGIIELLQRVGENNIRLQFLGSSLANVQAKKNGDVLVTFATGLDLFAPIDAIADKPRNVGVVLWLPQADVERATAEHEAGQPVGVQS